MAKITYINYYVCQHHPEDAPFKWEDTLPSITDGACPVCGQEAAPYAVTRLRDGEEVATLSTSQVVPTRRPLAV